MIQLHENPSYYSAHILEYQNLNDLKTIQMGTGVQLIIGKDEQNVYQIQSIHFAKEHFTEVNAKLRAFGLLRMFE